jgi:hypothetical protein
MDLLTIDRMKCHTIAANHAAGTEVARQFSKIDEISTVGTKS